MTAPAIVENVTCLGCGCACDDIGVVVRDGRIIETRNACTIGTGWFGDGLVPMRCVVDGVDVAVTEAILSAARSLREAERSLVYLAPDLACESQRQAAAIADLLGARLDSPTSATASASVLFGQERGLAAATLGEVRNRADVVVFWGVDISGRYPRFIMRYVPDAVGTHAPRGGQSRTVLAVDVDHANATVEADRRFAIHAREEVETLAALEALVPAPSDDTRYGSLTGSVWSVARELGAALRSARYIGLVYDAELDDRAERSIQRFDALASLSQSLNAGTRCAAIALRAGGNCSGADSVLVAQTGSPCAVDFSRGYPRYDPHQGSAGVLLRQRELDVVLIAGDPSRIPDDVARALNDVRCVVIGPHASEFSLGHVVVAIDTGRDGVHAGGTAFRADDVPLPLRASLDGPARMADILHGLALTIRRP